MTWRLEQVLMFGSSFSVKVGSDCAIIETHTNVLEGYRRERMIKCKFNSEVNVIEISSEGLEVVERVCPYHEDLGNETPPYV